MDAKIVYESLHKMFNGGFEQKGIAVEAANPFVIEISTHDDSIQVTFKSKVVGKYTAANRFLTPLLSFRLIGIKFTSKGGIIQIEHFPDIPFNYETV